MRKKVSTIYKTLVYGGQISLAVLDTTAVVGEAIRRHGLSPVAAAAFGRTLTVSAYLCSWLKESASSLSVTVKGDGVGGKICISGDGDLHMRGFAENPQANLPPRADGKLDVGGYVGRNGTLTVVRDDGAGIPFVGTSELVSGEIGEDFSAYFYASEQRPTAIAVGVKIGTDGTCLGAGGVIMQPLPYADEENIARAEREITKFSAVSSLIAERGAEEIMRAFFGEEAKDGREIFYRCHCSREKAEGLVLSMGEEEARKLLEEEGVISVHCHYCNTDYTFGGEETAELFRREKTNGEERR